MNATERPAESGSPSFLPDICQRHAVLPIILGALLGSVLFTLLHSGPGHFDTIYFSLTALFMLWVVLTSIFLVCRMQSLAQRLSIAWQGSLAWLISIVVTVIYSTTAALLFPALIKQLAGPFQFVLHTALISALVTGLMLRYFYLQFLTSQRRESELEFRLEALQARIRPHFLFNSMNSIASLIPEDPVAAEAAVLDLSKLFRVALRKTDQLISLAEELSICKAYLDIEKLRLGDRLSVEWPSELPGFAANARLPPLTLQPIVENAVYHGIQPLPQGGTLSLQLSERDRFCYVMISNPIAAPQLHPRSDASRLGEEEKRSSSGNRMALDNTRQRLAAAFGDAAVLKNSRTDDTYIVTVRMPLHSQTTPFGLIVEPRSA